MRSLKNLKIDKVHLSLNHAYEISVRTWPWENNELSVGHNKLFNQFKKVPLTVSGHRNGLYQYNFDLTSLLGHHTLSSYVRYWVFGKGQNKKPEMIERHQHISQISDEGQKYACPFFVHVIIRLTDLLLNLHHKWSLNNCSTFWSKILKSCCT